MDIDFAASANSDVTLSDIHVDLLEFRHCERSGAFSTSNN